MSLRTAYYNLSKEASVKPWLLSAGVGGTLGGLYGIGDSDTNYYNDALHSSVMPRSAQGAASALASLGGYKLGRGFGAGRLTSGLLGVLSAAGASALTKPKLQKDSFMGLPY
mgnify:CR=1 FL=1